MVSGFLYHAVFLDQAHLSQPARRSHGFGTFNCREDRMSKEKTMIVGAKRDRYQMVAGSLCTISREWCLGNESPLHLNIFVSHFASPHCRYLVPCVGKFTINNVCMTQLMISCRSKACPRAAQSDTCQLKTNFALIGFFISCAIFVYFLLVPRPFKNSQGGREGGILGCLDDMCVHCAI